jgi:HAMP domain-containing protein
MSLRLKILSGFLILTVMLFAAGALSIFELMRIGRSVQSLLDENYRSIDAAKNMIEALEREDSGILLMVSGELERGRATIEAADRDFQKALEIAGNNITISGEADYVAAILNSYKSFRSQWSPPISGAPKGDLSWYFNQVHPSFLQAKETVNRLRTLNDRTLYDTASALKNRARRSIMPGVIAIIAALIFTAVFNFFINLYFLSPIKKLTEGIRHYIKTGKRSGMRVSSQDEIGKLAAAIEDLSLTQGHKDHA